MVRGFSDGRLATDRREPFFLWLVKLHKFSHKTLYSLPIDFCPKVCYNKGTKKERKLNKMKAKANFSEEEIKSAKKRETKVEDEKEKEEPTVGSPTPDNTPFSIGALMIKKMIEIYEKRK